MATASPTLFDALKPVAGRALEAALNRLLALDPETQVAVAALEGRRVQLVMEALALEVSVREGRLAVGPVPAPDDSASRHDAPNEPDLAVRGTLGGLLSQLPFLRPASGASVGKVKIAGDAELARQLQKLAVGYDPDWNLPFTHVFGDVPGVQIASAVRAAFRAGRDGAARLARDAAEFLTEESRDLVGRAELEAHLDDVDALRDRIERLHARMQHLHRRLGGDASGGDASARTGAKA
ncbi:MAG TPA: SCP2 sterol-binding domain-containing protein [Xanthomonadaceae bacterium]|jgi:ubiquinone biosynthesis protein UbiJ